MKLHEDSANRNAAKGLAKIMAVCIILSVAAFGDVMYIQQMQKVLTNDSALMMFCYIGAFTSFAAIAYLLLGKSVVFSPGGQMIAAWAVFGMELLIIALNIILVFDKDHSGFLGMWAFVSPATPVLHMLGVAIIYFLDPEHLEKQRDKELQSKLRQLERSHQYATAEARMTVRQKQLEHTIREMDTAVNSPETIQRITQHAQSMNDDLLTEMSGRTVPSVPKEDDIYNSRNSRDGYYGRR